MADLVEGVNLAIILQSTEKLCSLRFLEASREDTRATPGGRILVGPATMPRNIKVTYEKGWWNEDE